MNRANLRDIKKEATAHALAEAAYELTLEKGLDGFVVEDVVQRAGYSRRTFANHYSCKEEAVVMAIVPFHGIEEAMEMLNNVPEGTTPLDVMYQFAKMQLTEDLMLKMRRINTLSREHPSLEPYMLSIVHRLQIAAQDVLDDLFRERCPAGYTNFLAGAVFAAINPLIDGTVSVVLRGQSTDDAADGPTLEQYLADAFHYLRNGF